MNIEKARDFFSAYYEETLEKGLRQSFEQKLRSDKQLQAEYDSFVRTMTDLDALKFEEIPIPIYLNARITARLEDARAPVKKQRGLVFYLPRFGIAAAAAAAIVMTVISIPRFGKSSVVPAGLDGGMGNAPQASPTPWPMESIQISGAGQTATLHYNSAMDRTVKICDKSGAELKSIALDSKQPLKYGLNNPNAAATIFEIQVSDGGPDELVAVPGSDRKETTGNVSGTLTDFALALADQYGKPVIVDSKNRTQPLSWNFDHTESKDAVDKAFDGLRLQEVQTSSGVLSLKDK